MLRIYDVCLEVVAGVRGVAEAVAVVDRDQARQLRRSSVSIALNVAEGSGVRGGNRRLRYRTALGSAEETRANLEIALAAGYVDELDDALMNRLRQIIGTLVRVIR